MAKVTSKSPAISVPMMFAVIGYIPNRNYRSERSPDSKMNALKKSFAAYGWWNNEPIPAERIKDVYAREGNPGEMAKCGPHIGGLMPDFVKDILAERQATWDALKADSSTTGQQTLVVFEKMFVHEGKLIKPEYLATATFQRGSQYFASQVQRYIGSDGEPGADPITVVPVEVVTFTDDLQRLEKQVQENEGRMIGNQPTSNKDKLRSAIIFFQRGKNQNFFRNLYSSSVGQKIHGLLRLNALWPDVKIYDRLQMSKPADDVSAESSDWIPFEKVDVKTLTAMIRRTPQAKERMEPGEQPVTAKDVDQYFRDLRKTSGNAPKVMGKDTVKSISEGNPAKIIQDIMQGVLENSTDRMNIYIPLAAGLNVLTELAQRGHYPPMELLLVKVSEFMKANPIANIIAAFRDAATEILANKPAPTPEPAPEPEPEPEEETETETESD